MPRFSLPDLAGFRAVARHKNFRKAALELGVSASALSHSLRALEERLGVRLLHRTTRSVALTEAGADLFERLQPALAEIQAALDGLDDFRASPRGTLRLSVPPDAARFVIAPKLAGFLACYPDIHVELVSDDHLLDIVAAGFDAGVRFHESLPQDMVAVPLGGEQQFAVVASPEYFATRSIPLSPQDLAEHECIGWRFSDGEHYHWEFEHAGQALTVSACGRLRANDPQLMLEAARQGLGVAYLLVQHVSEDVRRGTLLQVLDAFCPAGSGFYLYYPSRRQLSLGLRVFIDYWRDEQ